MLSDLISFIWISNSSADETGLGNKISGLMLFSSEIWFAYGQDTFETDFPFDINAESVSNVSSKTSVSTFMVP